MMRLLAVALAICLPLQAAADAVSAARTAAQSLQAAATALAEAEGARDRVEALTETVGAYEDGLLALREGIRQAARRERAILMEFQAEEDRLRRLLGVLQSIQSAPGPLLLLHPDGPRGTARAGMIVADVTPAIAREAGALRERLDELAALRAVQETAEAQLATGLAEIQTARAALSQAIADRRDLPPPVAMDHDAMAALLSDAVSMDDLAVLLAAQPSAAPEDMADFDTAKGRLPVPVRGTLLRRFGEADAAGISRPGFVIASRPRALVSAPWPASVRYAGPLLDYGNVIILEPESDYLIVIAGLGDVLVQAGELVSGATALGLMPGPETGGNDVVVPDDRTGGSLLSESLYLEVRSDGQAVDPAEWFALD